MARSALQGRYSDYPPTPVSKNGLRACLRAIAVPNHHDARKPTSRKDFKGFTCSRTPINHAQLADRANMTPSSINWSHP